MASFFTSLRGLWHSKPAHPDALGALRATPLAIPHLMAVTGTFPPRRRRGPATFTMGMIQTFAGSGVAFGAPRANGQPMRIVANTPLFSILGTTYGGNGITDYALPDFKGRVAAAGRVLGRIQQGTLAITFVIAATGPSVPPGTVMAFAGNFAPQGWILADGSVVPIGSYRELFDVIGTTFGGDGTTSFGIPGLLPCEEDDPPLSVVVGAGTPQGGSPLALGQRVPDAVGEASGLALNFLICVEGAYPSAEGSGAFPDGEPFLGQIIAFAGPVPPPGWARCDGTLMSPHQYAALYSVLGTAYGGDGINTFAVPDLRGRAIAGV